MQTKCGKVHAGVCRSRVLAQTRTMENVEKELRAIALRKFFENVPNAWWEMQTPVVVLKGVWELASSRGRQKLHASAEVGGSRVEISSHAPHKKIQARSRSRVNHGRTRGVCHQASLVAPRSCPHMRLIRVSEPSWRH